MTLLGGGRRREDLMTAATRWPKSDRMPAPEMASEAHVAAALGHLEAVPDQRKMLVKAQFEAQRRESSRKMPESVKEQNRLNLSKAQSGNSAAPKVRGVDGNGQLVKREATPSPNMRSPMPPPEDDDHGLVLMDEEDDVVAIV